MTTATATSATTTAAPQAPAKSVNSAVAVYRHHTDAEDAVHRLERAGIPMQKISIIGRNFELRQIFPDGDCLTAHGTPQSIQQSAQPVYLR
jgi:hypothetical protein